MVRMMKMIAIAENVIKISSIVTNCDNVILLENELRVMINID